MHIAFSLLRYVPQTVWLMPAAESSIPRVPTFARWEDVVFGVGHTARFFVFRTFQEQVWVSSFTHGDHRLPCYTRPPEAVAADGKTYRERIGKNCNKHRNPFYGGHRDHRRLWFSSWLQSMRTATMFFSW